jgi:hypothetical protein
MTWIHANTIVGTAAEGSKYFNRTSIEKELWREIKKGNHILFSAPRRVGKSSVMKYLAAKCPEDYLCVYENISSDDSANKFYKRLFHMVARHATAGKKLANAAGWIKERLGVEEITVTGVTFKDRDSNDIIYKDKFLNLLSHLKETEVKTVLFLDEFPDVLKNILEYESKQVAKDVLQTLRSVRENDHFKGAFTLVLAGSIGLEHVVKNIDRPAVINDLYDQLLPELNAPETAKFLDYLLDGATMQVNVDCRKYLMDKLQQSLPYYIQLIIEACDSSLHQEDRPELTTEDIDKAWRQVIAVNKNFVDAEERLKDYFKADYNYYAFVLRRCAHAGKISIQEVFDLYENHAPNAEFKGEYKGKIDDVLVKDGYLVEHDGQFKFASPLLQDWWKHRHPLLNENR